MGHFLRPWRRPFRSRSSSCLEAGPHGVSKLRRWAPKTHKSRSAVALPKLRKNAERVAPVVRLIRLFRGCRACWKWVPRTGQVDFGPQQGLGERERHKPRRSIVAPADSPDTPRARNKRNKTQFMALDTVSAGAASEVRDRPFGGFRGRSPPSFYEMLGVVAVHLASKHRLLGQLQQVSLQILIRRGHTATRRAKSGPAEAGESAEKCVGFCVTFRRKPRFFRSICAVFEPCHVHRKASTAEARLTVRTCLMTLKRVSQPGERLCLRNRGLGFSNPSDHEHPCRSARLTLPPRRLSLPRDDSMASASGRQRSWDRSI